MSLFPQTEPEFRPLDAAEFVGGRCGQLSPNELDALAQNPAALARLARYTLSYVEGGLYVLATAIREANHRPGSRDDNHFREGAAQTAELLAALASDGWAVLEYAEAAISAQDEPEA